MRDLGVYSQIYYRGLSVVLFKTFQWPELLPLFIVDAFLEIVLITLLKGHLYSMRRTVFLGAKIQV